MKILSPAGAPLSASSVTGSPVRREASSPGLAMVAEAMMNCGVEP